jgi:hypothetical protein
MLLHELLASDNENIQLEYSNVDEASNAAQSIRIYVEKHARQPLLVFQRQHYVIIVKKKQEDA